MSDPIIIIREGSLLNGEAMPRILANFRAAVIGRRIVDAGYWITEATEWSPSQAVPLLVLDDGSSIAIYQDDEANGPGVPAYENDGDSLMLPETQPKPTSK